MWHYWYTVSVLCESAVLCFEFAQHPFAGVGGPQESGDAEVG